MRFVLALVTFVVAAALITLGIAQRTVLLPSNHATVSAAAPEGVHYVVVPGSVLRSHAGRQRIHLAGPGTTFAAYGRQADVTAWLSGERYAQLRVDADGKAMKPVVRTAPVVAGLAGGGNPDPNGSDLWLDQERAHGDLDWSVNLPSSVALIVASDGSTPAPAVSVSWPVRVSTPYATPLIVAGSLLALLGLLLYIWALIHLRRRRGPRRKPPARMPRMPQPPKYRPAKPQLVGSSKGRRAVRRSALGAGVTGAALLLSGCQAAPAPAATPSAKAVVAVTPAAVSEEQATRIVAAAAQVASHADAKRDAKLLPTRFTGTALALRQAAYRIRKSDKQAPLPQALPTTGAQVRLILPEATPGWPRTLFTVVTGSDTKVPPVALTFVQQNPRDEYRVAYEMSLVPNAKLPDLPQADIGTARLAPDTKLLTVPPGRLAEEYGLLLRTPGAPEAAAFDTGSDKLLAAVGAAAKKKAEKNLGSTAKVSFKDAATDPASVVALLTANSGALVSVDLDETWTVKPAKSGVTVKPSGGTKILAGTSSTTKGIASTYGYQLLFSVPSAGSSDPIELLGYAQGLISAKEL